MFKPRLRLSICLMGNCKQHPGNLHNTLWNNSDHLLRNCQMLATSRDAQMDDSVDAGTHEKVSDKI